MKLTEKQKGQINEMFTGKKFDRVITAIQKQRGPQNYFDSNGNLLMNKSEIEARIERTEKRNIWLAKRGKKEKATRAISTMDVSELKTLQKRITDLIAKKNKATVKNLKEKVNKLNHQIHMIEKS